MNRLHNITRFWILILGLQPPRQLPSGNSHGLDNCHLGILPPKTTATQDNCHPCNWHPYNWHLWQLSPMTTVTRTTDTYDNRHPWQLSPRTIVTQDNCHPRQLPPGQLLPEQLTPKTTLNQLEQGSPNFFVRGPQSYYRTCRGPESYVMWLFWDMLHSTKPTNFL